MTMRFVIDERSIDLNGLNAGAALEVIDVLLDRIDDARDDGHGVCFDEDLFSIELVAQRSFWALFDPQFLVPLTPELSRHAAELSERAAATFGSMQRWYEVNAPSPVDVDASIDGGPIEMTGSVAWAHQQSIGGGLSSAACICASGRRRTGVINVEVAGHSAEVWFIASAHEMQQYFRWLISRYATRPDEIAEFSSSAFKRLSFVEQCFDGIRNMSSPCRQLAPAIVHHLSVLSDEGQRIFSGPWIQAPAEFGTFGVDISDENGNTKQNSHAKSERRRIFSGKELIFWWHTKIERDRDRIHIYPNNVADDGNIIVGVFCQHLTV